MEGEGGRAIVKDSPIVIGIVESFFLVSVVVVIVAMIRDSIISRRNRRRRPTQGVCTCSFCQHLRGEP